MKQNPPIISFADWAAFEFLELAAQSTLLTLKFRNMSFSATRKKYNGDMELLNNADMYF